MQYDAKRLSVNQKTLLGTLPEIVLLVHTNGIIEYMNPYAAQFFSEQGKDIDKKQLQKQLDDILNIILEKKKKNSVVHCNINQHSFECYLAPFTGYNGDNLHWLILKHCFLKKPVHKDPVVTRKTNYDAIVGSSSIMQDLKDLVQRVGKTDAPTLITGESGTGKELVANLLYSCSARSNQPFLTINCNALNDSILESELFGYEKGAFSGAYTQKKGKFESVDGGTIFLDEIGDISTRMQAVLLRVIQHGEIIRVGSNTPIKVDVRIIAATNKDLSIEVHKGRFRLDLFYRLNIINIKMPPLRKRGDDIIELADYFIKRYNTIFERNVSYNTKKIENKLMSYNWPGNVRELENVIQRAILINSSGTLDNDSIIFDMQVGHNESTESLVSYLRRFKDAPLKGIVEQIEKEVIIDKLRKNNGNVANAAGELDISKAALYEKMKRHAISAKNLRWAG